MNFKFSFYGPISWGHEVSWTFHGTADGMKTSMVPHDFVFTDIFMGSFNVSYMRKKP